MSASEKFVLAVCAFGLAVMAGYLLYKGGRR